MSGVLTVCLGGEKKSALYFKSANGCAAFLGMRYANEYCAKGDVRLNTDYVAHKLSAHCLLCGYIKSAGAPFTPRLVLSL